MFKHKLELTHEELASLTYNMGYIPFAKMGLNNTEYDEAYTSVRDKIMRAWEGNKPKPKSPKDIWDAINSVCGKGS